MPLKRYTIGMLMALYMGFLMFNLYQLEYELASMLVLAPLSIWAFYLLVYRFTEFLYLMVFLVPMSVGLKDVGGGFGLSVPFEPLLWLAVLAAGLLLVQGQLGNKKMLNRALFWWLILQHAWVLLTTLLSQANFISLKFFVARSFFLLVFVFLFGRLFESPKHIKRFFRAYLLGFAPIVLYSIFRLASNGIARRYSPDMAEPFFDDHTIFGACLAMLLPLAWLFFRQKSPDWMGKWPPWLGAVVLTLVLGGLYTSFSRAAWMSVIFIGFFSLLIRFKVSFKVVMVGILAVVTVVFFTQDRILESMRENKNVSGENLAETARSVTNVKTDESNQERVNRWSCAVRMWEDRPLLGFGPGTYERFYPDYQLKAEMTRISSKQGDRGDAHSEYLTALSEQGLPGLFLWLGLLVLILRSGLRIAYRAEEEGARLLGKAILLGLLTYFVHGAVNSFLDLDEAATLFWAMVSMLLALDIKFVPFRTQE